MQTPNKITDQMTLDNGRVYSRLTVLNIALTYSLMNKAIRYFQLSVCLIYVFFI